MTYRFNDSQENINKALIAEGKRFQDKLYVELNNLFLSIQTGKEKLTIHNLNRLYILIDIVFPSLPDNFEFLTHEHWRDEVSELPGFLEV